MKFRNIYLLRFRIVFIFVSLLVLTYINKNASGGGSWPASQEKNTYPVKLGLR